MTAAYWKARVLAATADPAALESLCHELAALAARRPELDAPSVSPATFAVPPEGVEGVVDATGGPKFEWAFKTAGGVEKRFKTIRPGE